MPDPGFITTAAPLDPKGRRCPLRSHTPPPTAANTPAAPISAPASTLDRAHHWCIALHGGTYTSAYFDIAGLLAARPRRALGIAVIAIDRPNYGGSTPLAERRLDHPRQRRRLGRAIESTLGRARRPAARHRADRSLHRRRRGHRDRRSHPGHGPCSAWRSPGASSGCRRSPRPPGTRCPISDDRPADADEGPGDVRARVGPTTTTMPAASHPSNTLVPKAELLDITGGWIESPSGGLRRGSPFPSITARVSSTPLGHRRGRDRRVPRRIHLGAHRSTPPSSPAAATASTSTCPAKRSSAPSWSSPASAPRPVPEPA